MLVSFRDSVGVDWDVWEVGTAAANRFPPRSADASPLPERASWLCFESATERRRLFDYPLGWDGLSPRELEELCQRAVAPKLTPREVPVFREPNNRRS